MDESTFEVVREALTKLKNDLAAAKGEAADLSDELQTEKARGEGLTLQLESINAENNDIVKQVNELRDTVDELQTEKRQFGDNFRGELRDILS